MIIESITQVVIDHLITFATAYLIPTMAVGFLVGVLLRALTYFSLRRQFYYAKEFGKRVREYYSPKNTQGTHPSFYMSSRFLLMKAFENVFIMRKKFMRRGSDRIMTIGDRIFLVEIGITRFIKDTLNQIKYIRRGTSDPRLLEVVKSSFDANPVFNKVIGIIPLGLVNEFMNILPGLFIIGGIFGTFLGIMKALPALGGMDLGDPEGSKQIMDLFLLKISFSMSTSIVGILLSVAMTTVNTILGPEALFYKLVNHFTSSMMLIWNETKNNQIPEKVISDKKADMRA